MASVSTHSQPQTPRVITLLDLVATVSDLASSEQETVLTIQSLLESGQVRLIGQFQQRHLGSPAEAEAA